MVHFEFGSPRFWFWLKRKIQFWNVKYLKASKLYFFGFISINRWSSHIMWLTSMFFDIRARVSKCSDSIIVHWKYNFIRLIKIRLWKSFIKLHLIWFIWWKNIYLKYILKLSPSWFYHESSLLSVMGAELEEHEHELDSFKSIRYLNHFDKNLAA